MNDHERPTLGEIVMAGPLGRKTTFSLRINGPYTSKEANHLIRLLEIQKDWFVEDEAEAPDETGSPIMQGGQSESRP